MQIADGIATFPNGLRLRLTPEQVVPSAVYDAASRHPEPQIPTVLIESTGRYEENPDDPEYHAAVERARERRAWASVRAMVVMGVTLESAPAGIPEPEAVDWDRLAAVRDVPSPSNPYDRFEMWLRYYAFGRGFAVPQEGLAEWLHLIRYLAAEAGLSMEGPAAVAATFRDNEGRAADPAGGAMAADGDGDGSGDAAARGAVGY